MSPLIIPDNNPTGKKLTEHGIFVMNKERAETQDIRPLKLCILNLMPNKVETEMQLLQKIGNSSLQIEVVLLSLESYESKHTSKEYLEAFYQKFAEIKEQYFDGLIITGAPVEHLEFTEVEYWHEIQTIFQWSETHVFSSLFICWASQAALSYFHHIPKHLVDAKIFGVYPHTMLVPDEQLFLGMNPTFLVPQSRHTESDPAAIAASKDLDILATSGEVGHHIIANKKRTQLFITGHPEYATDTLYKEYLRDVDKNGGQVPQNYFKNDVIAEETIENFWTSDASMFYLNWLNYYVYQKTEYEIEKLERRG